jgi:hypothetical protein
MTHSDLPNPAGATKVYDWEPPEVTGDENGDRRYFNGSSWAIERPDDGSTGSYGPDVTVEIVGSQWASGQVERCLRVALHPDYPLNIEQARSLRDALSAAIEEAEAMALYDRPPTTGTVSA